MVLLKYGLKELIQDIQPNLHSNMVLLKCILPSFIILPLNNLHSNMVLLKSYSCNVDRSSVPKFTFQYGTT